MANNNQNYFCGWCNLYFGYAKDGEIKCPTCGKSRKDNLNQVDKQMYECIKCGCVFSDISEKPTCPNGC